MLELYLIKVYQALKQLPYFLLISGSSYKINFKSQLFLFRETAIL